jgi:hypothetical protein
MNRRDFLGAATGNVVTAIGAMAFIEEAMADPTTPPWFKQSIQRVMKGDVTLEDILYLKPELIMQRSGMKPDPWQVEVLRNMGDMLVTVSRQRGKTQCAACLALLTAIIKGPCTVLYTSRTLRQVAEFMRRIRSLYALIRAPALATDEGTVSSLDIGERDSEVCFDWEALSKKEMDDHWGALPLATNNSVFQLVLHNGSRIVGIPPKEETVRGFDKISLLIIDEAARIPDEFYLSSGAYVLVNKGRRVAFSTPFGRRGWFWEAFEGPKKNDDGWKRMLVTALGCQHTGRVIGPDGMPLPMCDDCRSKSNVRLDPAWILREKNRIGDRWFRQEYACHDPKTPVAIHGGTSKPIGTVEIGDMLCHKDIFGRTTPCHVTYVQSTSVKPMVEVILENGMTISVSKGHSFVTSEGKQHVEDAKDIMIVPRWDLIATPEAALARLVAFNMGDGTVTERMRTGISTRDRTLRTWADRKRNQGIAYDMPPDVDITTVPRLKRFTSFYSKFKSDLDEVAQDFVRSKLSETYPHIGFKKGTIPEYDSWQIQVGGDAAEKLVELGCPIGKKVAQAFFVPDWIMDGSDTVKTEFMATLFGCEGSTPFTNRGGMSVRQPEMSMYKIQEEDGVTFFNQLKTICKTLGMDSQVNVSPYKHKSLRRIRFQLVVNDAKTFFEKVGFRFADRKSLLAFQWLNYLKSAHHEPTRRAEIIQFLKDNGFEWDDIATLGVPKNTKRSKARKGFHIFSDWVQKRWQNGGLMLKVIRRFQHEAKEVMNITVDSPDHSYLLANGLNNYNCSFEAAAGAIFATEHIQRMRCPTLVGWDF